jgi:hypothetical protein
VGVLDIVFAQDLRLSLSSETGLGSTSGSHS